jgi:DNA-binding transcriptional MerR regulator
MFTSDFASDFSGLSSRQILALEKTGVLMPCRERGIKYYTFGDIYVLRVFRILQRLGIRHPKIKNAFQYLRELKPEDPLSSFVLLHDGREVYSILDGKQLISASQYGQRILEGVIQLEAIGSELELTRRALRRCVEDIHSRSAQERKAKRKSYSSDDLDQLFA